jgi:hypothetical protein
VTQGACLRRGAFQFLWGRAATLADKAPRLTQSGFVWREAATPFWVEQAGCLAGVYGELRFKSL